MNKGVFVLGCSLFSFAVAEAQKSEASPNIIYILMDDLGYGDLQCYGQQKIETPNIDRLRADGMLFTQHYSGSPVSGPSRCVLMTGMHSGHSQIRGNDELASRGAVQNHDSMFVHKELEGQYPLKAGTMTLGRMLQKAGYITGVFGKWGLGYPTSDGVPTKQGFDKFYGYNCQRQAHTYYPPFLYDNDERVYLQNHVINPHQQLDKSLDPYNEASYAMFTQKQYSNDLIFDELMSFVDTNKDKQFFLMWTTPLPHVSLQAPDRWVKYYVNKFGDEKPYIGASGYMPCRYPHATYAAMISYFDEQVGKLIEKLKVDGLYDNTLIVYTSDNGPTFNGGTDSPWFNSGGLFKSEYGWGKCFLHEGGIRVPAIFSWPGKIKSGSKTDLICGFQDMMPTFAEVAGVDSVKTDGISILPTLTGKKQKVSHEYLYWEFPELQGERAVRWGKWKALWSDIKKGNKHVQLFDLSKDIKEQNDLSSQHPEVVEKMVQMMNKEHVDAENPKFRM